MDYFKKRISSELGVWNSHAGLTMQPQPWLGHAVWDVRGFAAFTYIAGIRFDQLNELLKTEQANSSPTFGVPANLIRHNKMFFEWKFSNDGDLKRLSDEILDDVKSSAIPFMERYSKLSELRKSVDSLVPGDWIKLGLDIDRRVCVMSAIRFIHGDSVNAIKILNNALLERSTALPKHRVDIERLRNKLLAREVEYE